MDDAVEAYLTDLARAEHDDPVLVDMEARAAEHGFPSVRASPAARQAPGFHTAPR